MSGVRTSSTIVDQELEVQGEMPFRYRDLEPHVCDVCEVVTLEVDDGRRACAACREDAAADLGDMFADMAAS